MATPERKVVPNLSADVLSERRRRLEATDKLEPFVVVSLKGKDYHLEYNNRSVKRIMADLGTNLIASGLSELNLEDPEHLGKLLWRGLETNHPELSEDDVDVLFTYKHYAYITLKIREALMLYMPDMSDLFVSETPGREGAPSDKDPT